MSVNKHAAMVSYTLTGMSQNSPVCANTSLIRRVKTPGALGRVSVTTGGSNVLSCSTTGSESSPESVSSERNESLSGLGTYVRISNLLDGVKTTPFFRVDGAPMGFFNVEVIVIGAFFRAECSALLARFYAPQPRAVVLKAPPSQTRTRPTLAKSMHVHHHQL